MLENLLFVLQNQETKELFEYSILIVDNDSDGSAKNIVDLWMSKSKIKILYYNEPDQNIALARNKAVNNSFGEYIAFIDDDEFPINRWLLNLLETCKKYKADGILGPVFPHFETIPPSWIIKGKFYEKPLIKIETGSILSWQETRTSNVLIKKSIFNDSSNRFDKNFLSGEDKEFFKRMIEKGHIFRWCNEAPVYETIPPERWKRSFMVRRALFRGQIAAKWPGFRPRHILKSVLAVSIYTLFLPIYVFAGQKIFMKYMIKNFYHIGKILSCVGIEFIKQKYVTD
jgi:glycosyltransferase involved in cell wall biosynthesis